MDPVALLDRHYDPIAKAAGRVGFFTAVADYIEFIETAQIPMLQMISHCLKAEEKAWQDNLTALRLSAAQALDVIRDKVGPYALLHEGEDRWVQDCLSQYDSIREGRAFGTKAPALLMADSLRELIKILWKKPGHRDFVRPFISFEEGDGPEDERILGYLNCREVNVLSAVTEKYAAARRVELWGIHADLAKYRDAVLHPENISNRFYLSGWKEILHDAADKGVALSLFNQEKAATLAARHHNQVVTRVATGDFSGRGLHVQATPKILTAPEVAPHNSEAILAEDGGIGYVLLRPKTKRLKIARVSSRQYRLVRALFCADGVAGKPFAPVARTVEALFEKIRLPSDAARRELAEVGGLPGSKEAKIESTADEIRKNTELKGVFSFSWRNTDSGKALSMSLNHRAGGKNGKLRAPKVKS